MKQTKLIRMMLGKTTKRNNLMKMVIGTPSKLNKYIYSGSKKNPRVLYRFKDSDKDGVPDRLDCRPFNPKKQDVTPNSLMMARINRLPIYVSRSSFEGKSVKYKHISEKQAPREVKQRVYSMIKRYPQLVGEIERKKPGAIYFTSSGGLEGNYGMANPEGNGKVLVRVIKPDWEESKQKFTRSGITEGAGTTVHELEHVRQFKAWSGKPKLQKRMESGRYSTRKEEVLAREAERKLHKSMPEQTMKTNLTTGYSKQHPRIFSKVKEKYEKYKQRKEEQKMNAFRQMMDEDEAGDTT